MGYLMTGSDQHLASKDDKNAVFSNLGCLKPADMGCNHIRDRDLQVKAVPIRMTRQDRHQCLSSKDDRPYDQVAGFKAPVFRESAFGRFVLAQAKGQPCVWCAGRWQPERDMSRESRFSHKDLSFQQQQYVRTV